MSAGRSASSLLITLLMTILLFIVFVVWSNLNILQKHAYDIGYGWQASKTEYPLGNCEHTYISAGFPVKSTKDDRKGEDPPGCTRNINFLASSVNYALYFAVAGIISVGVVESMRKRLP